MSRFTKLLVFTLCLAVAPTLAVADHHEGAEHHDGGMPPMGRPAEMDQVAFMIGEWEVSMEMRMLPDAPWTSSTATAKTESVLDGCAQRMHFSGEIMGMPFHGQDLSAFNRETGRFQSTWIDNMSAHTTYMEGGFDGGKLVMTGSGISMGEPYMARSTSEKKSENEVYWVMETSMDGGETWWANMKMTYTRKGTAKKKSGW